MWKWSITENLHMVLKIRIIFSWNGEKFYKYNCQRRINWVKYISYTFSFEINQSRLSDTRCLIQDVVSPHCGDKELRDVARDVLCRTTLTWRHTIGMWDKALTVGNERKNNVASYTKCSLSQSIVHILIQPLLFV